MIIDYCENVNLFLDKNIDNNLLNIRTGVVEPLKRPESVVYECVD